MVDGFNSVGGGAEAPRPVPHYAHGDFDGERITTPVVPENVPPEGLREETRLDCFRYTGAQIAEVLRRVQARQEAHGVATRPGFLPYWIVDPPKS